MSTPAVMVLGFGTNRGWALSSGSGKKGKTDAAGARPRAMLGELCP